jgi:WbqC-like protein family
MTKRIAIIQSCYIPWRGFFDLISRCDEYVLFDSVQYRKRHWHNRNQIKTPSGLNWLTIPVQTKSRFLQPIDEVEVEKGWAATHWASFKSAYTRAPHFAAHAARLEALFLKAHGCERLTDINTLFLQDICDQLDLKIHMTRDTDYAPEGQQSERLLDICKKAGATHYLSGPSAAAYLDVDLFQRNGITPEWMGYAGYPEYRQLWGDFEGAVSVLDMILNAGAPSEGLWRGVGR